MLRAAAVGLLALTAGALGCSASGTTAPEVCGPHSAAGQLDDEPDDLVTVARDENHVALLRDPQKTETGCPARATQWTTGTLVVASLLPGNATWSPGGGCFAFCHGLSGPGWPLALVAADGSARTEVSANCFCQALTFAPDDSWLAYQEPDDSGGTRLVAHSLQGGNNVTLGVLPAGDARVIFSDEARSVVALVRAPGSIALSVYAATAAVTDSLRLLTAAAALDADAIADGDHVAASGGSRSLEVSPVADGAAVDVDGLSAQFEPAASDPHLLIRQKRAPGIGVARGDGTGALFQAVPDSIIFASWLGPTAVYATGASDVAPLALVAITDAGATTTELARAVDGSGWAAVDAPSRLFYARVTSSPPGLWVVDLPR